MTTEPITRDATHYHADTTEEVRRVLESARINGTRIRVHYGDTGTGRDWGDLYDVTGKLGRSMGPMKVPILLHDARSMGGGAILDHCIVRVRHANRSAGGDLYRHPSYSPPNPDEWVGGVGTSDEYRRNFA